MSKYSKYFIPLMYIGVVGFMVLSSLFLVNSVKNYLKEDIDYKYALDGVFEGDVIPVMKTENEMIVRPYIDENVKVGKYFYDYESNIDKQQNSIIFYENTYMQNTGVDYISNEVFDVVSVLDGEVIGIEDSEIYGKIVTIKHNDNLITSYSNISDVLVTLGYKVSQGEIIATSNSSVITNDDALLHFEVLYKGEYIDPENLYTLKVSDIQ